MCGPIRLARAEVRRRTLFTGLRGTPGGRGSRPSYMEPLLELLPPPYSNLLGTPPLSNLLGTPPLRIQIC